MRVYISGSFAARDRLRKEKEKLISAGHEVVSSWLEEIPPPLSLTRNEFWRKLAVKDLGEVRAADLVIVDTLMKSTTGGTYCELGSALSAVIPKAVWLIGKIDCVFETLTDRQFQNWEDAHVALEMITEGIQ